MLAFITRRILSGLVTLLILTTLAFFLVHGLMPGDYAGQFLGMSAEEKAELRHELGLDLPLWTQYGQWLAGLFDGQLGQSFGGLPVTEAIGSALPPTLLVFLTGGGAAFVLGLELAKATGWRRSWLISEGTAVSVIALYAMFPPALGFLLRHFLAERLEWFPPGPSVFWYRFEREFPTVNAHTVMVWMVLALAAATLAAFGVKVWLYRWRRIGLSGPAFLLLAASGWVASWFALGVGWPAVRLLHFASLPILAFTLLTLGEITIITRASLAETAHEEYINTARAKGLPEAAVRDRHAARNALLPVVSKAVVSLPYILAGLAMVEYALEWPGLGTAVFNSALAQDMPLVLGFLVFIGLVALGARLALELAYALLDPRVGVRLHAKSLEA